MFSMSDAITKPSEKYVISHIQLSKELAKNYLSKTLRTKYFIQTKVLINN